MPLMFLMTLWAPKEAMAEWMVQLPPLSDDVICCKEMRSPCAPYGWDATDIMGGFFAVASVGLRDHYLAFMASAAA